MTKIEMIQQIINIKCRISYPIRFEGDIKSYIINIAASILTKEELFELLI